MEIDILDFIEQCRDLAKQALGKHAGEPASGGFAEWAMLTVHALRIELAKSYRVAVDLLSEMPGVLE